MQSIRKKSFAAEQLAKRQRKNPATIAIIVLAVVITLGVVGYAVYVRFGKKDTPTDIVATKEEIKSIAVLPLESFSKDQDHNDFTNAMHSAIITNLSRICAGIVRVTAHRSTIQYRESDKTASEIAQDLDVDAVIEGDVYSSGNQVRITVQLIAVNPERHLWQHVYTEEMKDVLSLQNQVAQAIAGAIKVAISPEEKIRLASAQSVNPEAFNLYVRGLHFLDQMKVYEAEKVLEQVVAVDPGFAQAYGLLSDLYYDKGQLEKAKKTADRAHELDPTNVWPYITYAQLHEQDSDWDAAEREIKQALTLDPSSSAAHWAYFNIFRMHCRYDEALEKIADFKKIDPRAAESYGAAVAIYTAMDRFDDAAEQYRLGMELNPGNTYISQHYARMLYKKGNYEKAKEILNNVDILNDQRAGYIDALAGKREEAEKVLNRLIRQYEEEHKLSIYIVFIYTAFGEKEKALDWLERQYRNNVSATFIKTDFEFDPLRSEPRFQAILEKMNLAD